MNNNSSKYNDVIAIIPGGYKPATIAHFHIIDEVSKRPEITKVKVIIGPKERDGIDKHQSMEIWNIYKKYLNNKVEFQLAETGSPIKDTIDFIKENPNNFYVLVYGREEDKYRFKSVEKFDNVKIININDIGSEISGTKARQTILDNNFEGFNKYLPTQLTDKERKKVWNIVKKKNMEEKKDLVPGGLAQGKTIQQISSHHRIPLEKLNIQLLKGIKVEMEHTTDKNIAREIAMDHLWEDPNYYDKLKKIETSENKTKDIFGVNVFAREIAEQTIQEDKSKLNSDFKKYISYINELVNYVCKDLQIKRPEIKIINNTKYTQENHSFGGYQPGANKIYLVIKNRSCSDSGRTIVHELFHAYQDQQGILTNESGKDGSDHENEANSYAGKIMREFNKKYPEILTLVNV